ncbi:MAG: aspartyl protease family protein [Acidobacteriota bacterium]
MLNRYPSAPLLLLALFPGTIAAQQGPPKWTTEGPSVGAKEFSLSLPLETLATKLHVEIELGGKPRRFVFDTGSPSMISKALVAELGLKVIDKASGRDSHGAVIESGIVQADLNIGGVTFRKVPMFAADLSSSEAVRCLVCDGVLGSELLPLRAWQVDLPDSKLRCNTNVRKLDHVKGAKKQRLHDFGYPHAPFLDVRFAKNATSTVMFDTGMPGIFSISPPDFEGAKRAGGVAGILSGHGSLGSSLGGQAPVRDQQRAELRSLSIGNLELGRIVASVRESPPSLVGAALLEQFVVTFDSRSGKAYFDPIHDGPRARSSFGFGLGFEGPITVSLVWEDSEAAKSGLAAGQTIDSINGEPTELSCDGIRKALLAMDGDTIELGIDGRMVRLERAPR